MDFFTASPGWGIPTFPKQILQHKPTARSVCNPVTDRIDFPQILLIHSGKSLQPGEPDLAGFAALLVTRCNQYSPEVL